MVKAESLKLFEPTRKEAGCLQYDLHQDNDHPEIFLFFEIWESRESWQEHMKTEHLKAYIATTESLIENLSISKMSQIGQPSP